VIGPFTISALCIVRTNEKIYKEYKNFPCERYALSEFGNGTDTDIDYSLLFSTKEEAEDFLERLGE